MNERQEVLRTLRNNPQVTYIENSADNRLVYWPASAGRFPEADLANKVTVIQFTKNDRIQWVDGAKIGRLPYRYAGKVSYVSSDITRHPQSQPRSI
jgi:hypothetical protein